MTNIASTPFSNFAMQAMSKPTQELADRTSGVYTTKDAAKAAQKGIKSIDGMNINRLYINKNNELKISSNWFSHVFRMVTGSAKAQGQAALHLSLKIEVGEEIADMCLRDLADFLLDEDRIAEWDTGGVAENFEKETGKELQSNPRNGLRFLAKQLMDETPEVEDFDDDDLEMADQLHDFYVNHDERGRDIRAQAEAEAAQAKADAEIHKPSTDYSDASLDGVKNLFSSQGEEYGLETTTASGPEKMSRMPAAGKSMSKFSSEAYQAFAEAPNGPDKARAALHYMGLTGDQFKSDHLGRAYKGAALSMHPDKDKTEGATQRFQQLGDVYDYLKSPANRRHFFDL